MSLDGFEALAIALLFLSPGALFLYESARYYSPAMRSEYLRRQFPLELTFYYLLASTLIHGILVFLLGGVILICAQIIHNPNLVKDWYKVLAQFPQVSVLEFFLTLIAGTAYLALSLLLAYIGAKRLRQHLLLPEPLWCEELIRILAQGGEITVKVVKQGDGPLEGQLSDLRYTGQKGTDFEMLLLVEGTDQTPETTVWLDSRVIREMDVQSSSGSWKFLFPSESNSRAK
jgi:hypothetical protein